MKKLRFLVKCYKLMMPGFKKPLGVPALIHPNSSDVYEFKRVNGEWVFPVKIPLQDGEYVGVTIAGKNYHLHKLKAETFLAKPRDCNEKLIVNHKDGDKSNNKVSNYEWVTYSGNIIHAYKTGLRTDNISGRAYDIIDGKEYEFYSYSDLSQQLGLHSSYLSYYMKKQRDYPFRRRYVIVLDGQSRPEITKDDIWKAGVGSEMPIRVFDTLNNSETTFSSFTSMKKTLNVIYAQRERLIPGKDFIFGKGRHIVTVLTEYDEIMDAFANDPNYVNRDHSHLSGIVKRNRVKVVYPNGEVKVFDDANCAAKDLGSTDAALSKRIHSFNGHWKGHVLSYV